MTLDDPNLDFKVTPILDAEYLSNDTRYGHCYNGRRLLVCDDLPMTLSDLSSSGYYSTSNNWKMVIELYLRQANSKSNVIYRSAMGKNSLKCY